MVTQDGVVCGALDSDLALMPAEIVGSAGFWDLERAWTEQDVELVSLTGIDGIPSGPAQGTENSGGHPDWTGGVGRKEY